jgi:light-regulated signal transduction histidine kinase (bacteriophytochrome)
MADVRQWLLEIKALQQKLAEVNQERDQAYASAANWRKLYETEAQQRRTEARLAQQQIEMLKAELQRLQQLPQPVVRDGLTDSEIQEQLEQLQPTEIKETLVRALMECDRLTQSLKAEQADHAQTRRNLTTALGDTVNLLAKERATRDQTKSGTPITNGSVV